jgi:hypothetical protein
LNAEGESLISMRLPTSDIPARRLRSSASSKQLGVTALIGRATNLVTRHFSLWDQAPAVGERLVEDRQLTAHQGEVAEPTGELAAPSFQMSWHERNSPMWAAFLDRILLLGLPLEVL